MSNLTRLYCVYCSEEPLSSDFTSKFDANVLREISHETLLRVKLDNYFLWIQYNDYCY